MTEHHKPGRCALRKGRYSQTGGIYLVTTVTEGRIPWFQAFDLASCMCKTLSEPKGLRDATILCWVVMPDHVHMLVQLAECSVSDVLRSVKAKSALRLNRLIGRKGRFWADGFHEHALRREEDLLGTARYIVANPIRAGLVSKAGQYPFWNAVWI